MDARTHARLLVLVMETACEWRVSRVAQRRMAEAKTRRSAPIKARTTSMNDLLGNPALPPGVLPSDLCDKDDEDAQCERAERRAEENIRDYERD